LEQEKVKKTGGLWHYLHNPPPSFLPYREKKYKINFKRDLGVEVVLAAGRGRMEPIYTKDDMRGFLYLILFPL
jgi:hypothetical protein